MKKNACPEAHSRRVRLGGMCPLARVGRVGAMLLSTLMASQAWAHEPDNGMAAVRRIVDQAARDVAAAHPGYRVEAQVGERPTQVKLAPCQAVEPYLPSGTRPWGTFRIGLRCVQGPVKWNVFIPATIRVQGPALVARAALPAGHVLAAGDLVAQEVDLTQETGAWTQDAAGLMGRSLTTALAAGQVVRAGSVRARQWYAAGEPVTLLARGPGFAISAEGVALTPGVDGQTSRIRLENGRVVQATAVGTRRAEALL